MSVRNGSKAAYHPVDKRIAGSTLLLSLIVSGGVAFAQISDISHPEASRALIEGMVKLADQQNQTEPVPGVPFTPTPSLTGKIPGSYNGCGRSLSVHEPITRH